MKKYLLPLLCVSLTSCAFFKTEPRRPADQGPSCPILENYKPVFSVLENNSEKIIVQLNNFVNFFKLDNEPYDVKVTFEDTDTEDFKYFGRPTIIDVYSSQINAEPFNVQVPVTRSGVYHFELSQDGRKPFWKQKVFAVAKDENTLTSDEKLALAKKYAPVLEMHPEERLYPASLEYILNKVDPDLELANEPFILTNKRVQSGFFSFFNRSNNFSVNFLYDDIDKVLPYFGHSESVLKSGLSDSNLSLLKYRSGKDHLTVYYSIFENKKYKEIYINYHFFYAFDTKNGTKDKDVMAAHIFDRESLTVVLRSTSKQPLYTFFGAHLPSQLMAQLDSKENVVQSWLTGRVFVNWPNIIMENNRIKAVAALGSHGIYPVKGLYAVMLNENFALLKEPAGGGEKLYPNFDTNSKDNLKYELKSLNLEAVTSNCQNSNNVLAFSGSTVDVLGPTNATFPPFTDRESDYKNYAYPDKLFDMKKAAEAK